MQTAREWITRTLEPAEVDIIYRALQILEEDYLLQRRLEALYGLPDSTKDSRMGGTNRWRLLTILPEVGLQVSCIHRTCSLQQARKWWSLVVPK